MPRQQSLPLIAVPSAPPAQLTLSLHVTGPFISEFDTIIGMHDNWGELKRAPHESSMQEKFSYVATASDTSSTCISRTFVA